MAHGPYCARSSLGLAQHIRARPSAACSPGPESPTVESAQLNSPTPGFDLVRPNKSDGRALSAEE